MVDIDAHKQEYEQQLAVYRSSTVFLTIQRLEGAIAALTALLEEDDAETRPEEQPTQVAEETEEEAE